MKNTVILGIFWNKKKKNAPGIKMYPNTKLLRKKTLEEKKNYSVGSIVQNG